MLKGELVDRALRKIGISSNVSPATEEDRQATLEELEAMIESWESQGIWFGYNLQGEPTFDADSGLPFWANAPVYNNLAVNVAGIFGVQVSPSTAGQARYGVNVIHSQTSCTKGVKYPDRMPRGSGNTFRNNNWLRFYRQEQQDEDCC